ncbi:MAG TPA: DUF5010 domain-containing protein [Chloroflexota bacterium]|jgi:hypothetical protein
MRSIAAAALAIALVACGASAKAQSQQPSAATEPSPWSTVTLVLLDEAPTATPPEPGIWRLALTPSATPEPAPAATEAPPNARDASGGYGPATPPPTLTPNPGFPGQSNLVPPGYPTPNSWNERLRPAGPARDPGPLTWARPGSYMLPEWSDFRLDGFAGRQPLVTTYYFYWHDLTDPERMARFRGRFNTPPNPARYGFLFPDTHYREFSDMLDAGMDFVLPVYWGEPGHPGRTTAQTWPHYWSTEGIAPMVEAVERLHNEGRPFKIGLFYDTTILANADLTTPNGREYFYVNVRDFYSRIPPKYWAAIDGKPIVWLYDTLWVSAFDQSSIDYLSERFAQDFGGTRLFVVGESQWEFAKHAPPQARLRLDGLYGWGAGPSGFNSDRRLTIAQVGPGFKNTQYCTGGAASNCFDIDREGGARYEQQLQQAVASGRQIVAVETWNEFSEGTEIAETIQTGRLYIELTRKYADLLKRAWR